MGDDIKVIAAGVCMGLPTPDSSLCTPEGPDRQPLSPPARPRQIGSDSVVRLVNSCVGRRPTLLHAAGLSQGEATRPLVLALAGLYGLTRACNAAELAAVTDVLPALWAQGVIACSVDWTGAQRRELRSRGVVHYEQWLVRSPDHRSKLSFSVRRQLSVQQDAEIGDLLQGARRSLAGMPQRHFLPAEDGLEAWVLQQDWLILDLAERVWSLVDLALTAAD